MEQTMENGLFWVCLAARYGLMFDEIYWTFIDKMYYGPLISIEDRLRYLSEGERSNLDEIVRVKMKQAKEGALDEHYTAADLVDLLKLPIHTKINLHPLLGK